jgi:hypothetical protein
MNSAGAEIEEVTMRTRPPEKKRALWLHKASRISFGREVRTVSYAVGEKVT